LANIILDKERRLIPNWRSFGKTTVLGELNSFSNIKSNENLVFGIDDYLIDWKANKSAAYASDLLSAAIVNNFTDDKEVISAANFIYNLGDRATKSQIKLAESILNRNSNDIIEFDNFDKIDNLLDVVNVISIREKISDLKNVLKKYPNNAILYVELSRLYSIIGQEDKSISSMKTALHISNDNRFILRSATRLFTHVNYDDDENINFIHRILKKTKATLFDPWLLSAELSLATLKNQNSKFIKQGYTLINSKNYDLFSLTELQSSLATIELLNGSHKKSRELFHKSLVKPNDNSLAQFEWATTKDDKIKLDKLPADIKLDFEAKAIDSFNSKKYDESIKNAIKWFADMPFSKRPIMFGSNLATIILKDHQLSIDFLNSGLISHPNDPQIINNLAYSFSLNNEPTKALSLLNKVNTSDLDYTTEVCLIATRGLAQYKLGNIEEGRNLYMEAIQSTKDKNERELNWIAILNFAREELLVNPKEKENLSALIDKIPDDSKNVEITTLKKDVKEIIEQI